MASKTGVKHLGVILDGNRRWAKARGLDPWEGHKEGVKRVEELLDNCLALGIKELTLYTFSVENFKRAPEEVQFLMDLFVEVFGKLAWKTLGKKGIKIDFIGRKHLLPARVQEALTGIEDNTESNARLSVHIAMAYSGICEVVDMTRRVAEAVRDEGMDVSEIDEKTVFEHLYLASKPELIIRTSGESRTSNFLPLQSAYSEWIFYPKMWPEFYLADLEICLKEYSDRERRFGK